MTLLARLRSGLLVYLLAHLVSLSSGSPKAARRKPQLPLFIDTDIGVDDAVAIAWLLRQPAARIIGFSTVFGNISVENATKNLLTLLKIAGASSIPVTVGASEPLALPRTRTGGLAHGPDGLWFAQQPADISGLPTDAAATIVAAAQANPGLTVVALGPLTNIANAVSAAPEAMMTTRIIALGGGTRGNRTPLAEFNIFADPEALAVVLRSGVKLELLTLDAFDQLRVDSEAFPAQLAANGGELGQLLATILRPYFQLQTGGASGKASIPDAAAVIYALQPDLATVQSALVQVITDSGPARGTTLIGNMLSSRIPLIADDAELSALADQAFAPGFDLNSALLALLQRQPDNARVIMALNGAAMARVLTRGLTS